MAKKSEKPHKHQKTAHDLRMEKEGPKEIVNRILKMSNGLVDEIRTNKDPTFVTSQRGRGNVSFSEDEGIITLG